MSNVLRHFLVNFPHMTYPVAKAARDAIYLVVMECSKTLQNFPKGNMGLTPDHVKALPEWKLAHSNYDTAFAIQREFNLAFNKKFKKEIQEDRRKKYQEKLDANK